MNRSGLTKAIYAFGLAATFTLSTPFSFALADEATPAPSISEGSAEHESGEIRNGVHREPENHIREERHGVEGIEMFLLGAAAVVAVGLAFLAGRKSHKNK